MTKNEARHFIKAEKSKLTASETAQKSRLVMDRLKALTVFQASDNIFTYVSCNQEVDTKGFIEDCLAAGKNVFVPKVYGQQMHFHKIDSLALLKAGKYGILEPVNAFDADWEKESGLMIMPGLAFDKRRNRVGYGGGFYDRYLEMHPQFETIAVCFDFQIVDILETESYDLKPQSIVSETMLLTEKLK